MLPLTTQGPPGPTRAGPARFRRVPLLSQQPPASQLVRTGGRWMATGGGGGVTATGGASWAGTSIVGGFTTMGACSTGDGRTAWLPASAGAAATRTINPNRCARIAGWKGPGPGSSAADSYAGRQARPTATVFWLLHDAPMTSDRATSPSQARRGADTTTSVPAKPDHGENSASTIVEAPQKPTRRKLDPHDFPDGGGSGGAEAFRRSRVK